ncbi:MAG: DUF4442 domain-containing protein [Gemmatimonadaceae bacterium]|nr:DUF4442 domain-containing protein [Gemmatimonadaceae bacterium]
MTSARVSLGQQLLANWERMQRWPFGKRLFSWAVGRMAPYTGTVGGVYTDVRPGFAQVELRDRQRVRNHLRSVHAVALVNLAEMTSGVALLTALPHGVRGIVSSLDIQYRKKARGTLTCSCTADAPDVVDAPRDHPVAAVIRDSAGDVVAECTVHWRISPVESS